VHLRVLLREHQGVLLDRRVKRQEVATEDCQLLLNNDEEAVEHLFEDELADLFAVEVEQGLEQIIGSFQAFKSFLDGAFDKSLEFDGNLLDRL